ncbi:TlyA family RNA methyltransferase [Candidatus Peregrinibacteria bacterium]|nr:TlyA family RNA methyltransferase [Candidatus Peregrinibacteria bacterium]
MKQRLDELLVKKGLAKTRSQAKLLIKEGAVLINDVIAKKPSTASDETDEIIVTKEDSYVSRGAYKLKGAIEKFQIDTQEKVIADVGASTGGFTDYLLQNGAEKIYAIDVGTGQLDTKIKHDSRVINMENTNIRDLNELPEKVDLAVIDLSYISLKLALPNVKNFLKPEGQIVALIKPQFEAGKGNVPKDGVIKDKEVIKEVIKSLEDWCGENGLIIKRKVPSQITGKTGNQEYLGLICPS